VGFQNKKKGNMKDEKYKVRLVVGGFFQTHGIDFEEIFAFIAKFVSIRTLVSLRATLDLEIHQMDVKCAFLNGDLDENIYMLQLKGNEVAKLKNFVYKLHKAIYGFKQAQRVWNMRIDGFLKSCNF
jgi:ATP-binding cassette subfamily B (MDR/TAP) protein 1